MVMMFILLGRYITSLESVDGYNSKLASKKKKKKPTQRKQWGWGGGCLFTRNIYLTHIL